LAKGEITDASLYLYALKQRTQAKLQSAAEATAGSRKSWLVYSRWCVARSTAALKGMLSSWVHHASSTGLEVDPWVRLASVATEPRIADDRAK
jgi:hypothetical protein